MSSPIQLRTRDAIDLIEADFPTGSECLAQTCMDLACLSGSVYGDLVREKLRSAPGDARQAVQQYLKNDDVQVRKLAITTLTFLDG